MNGLSSRAASQPARSPLKVSDYLVGTQLDDALAAGEDITVLWPFADGEIRDFVQAEAIWLVYLFAMHACILITSSRKYVLFNKLGRKRTQNESPALLTFIHGLSRDAHENICQIFFERFNIAALSILERPLAQMYAANGLSGLVVDIGQDKTDITPINDCFVQHNCCDTVPLGIIDCELYLAHLLKSNQNIVNILSPPDAPLTPEVLHSTLVELAQQVWRDGLVKVPSDGETAQEPDDEGVTNIAAVLVAGKEKAVIESGMKKRANAKASAAEQARAKEIEALDLITVQFREYSLTLGRERHRFCEPLFDPTLLYGVEGIREKPKVADSILSVQDACGLAVAKADVDARLLIWGGLFVTGDCTSLVKGVFVSREDHSVFYFTFIRSGIGTPVSTGAVHTQ